MVRKLRIGNPGISKYDGSVDIYCLFVMMHSILLL